MSRRADREEAAHLQYETEHTDPPKSRSVMVYMIILIAAAFLLLLLAYFMQVRTASTVEGLHQSVNSFQTIDQLVEDNRDLQEEADRLTAENAQLQAALDAAQKELADAEAQKTGLSNDYKDMMYQANSLSALNQLRVLYNKGRYKDARALLEAHPYMEEALTAVSEGMTDAEREVYDPLASYQRMARLLGAE